MFLSAQTIARYIVYVLRVFEEKQIFSFFTVKFLIREAIMGGIRFSNVLYVILVTHLTYFLEFKD